MFPSEIDARVWGRQAQLDWPTGSGAHEENEKPLVDRKETLLNSIFGVQCETPVKTPYGRTVAITFASLPYIGGCRLQTRINDGV